MSQPFYANEMRYCERVKKKNLKLCSDVYSLDCNDFWNEFQIISDSHVLCFGRQITNHPNFETFYIEHNRFLQRFCFPNWMIRWNVQIRHQYGKIHIVQKWQQTRNAQVQFMITQWLRINKQEIKWMTTFQLKKKCEIGIVIGGDGICLRSRPVSEFS